MDKQMAEGENRLSPKLRYKLYVNRFLEAWADRCWSSAVGLYLFYFSQESLSLQAIHGIISSLAVVLLLPYIGRWVHRTERLLTARIVLFLQNFSICISAVAVSAYWVYLMYNVDSDNRRRAKMMFYACAAAMIAFASSAKVWFHGYSVILEHDWMVAMAGNTQELTDLNATLRRIDLATKLVAPGFVGILAEYNLLVSAVFLMIWIALSAFVESALMSNIYETGPKEIREPRNSSTPRHGQAEDGGQISQMGAIVEYFTTFTLPGISYALVYLTVIGMDTITTGFLLHQGVTADMIGLVSTLCGLTGVVATVVYPPLVRCVGLSWSAFIGYTMQASCCCLCLVNFMPTKLHSKFIIGMSVPNFLFISGIVLSRTGLWIADLAANQLIQYTPNPAIVSGMQRSLNTFMELVKFVLVIYFPSFDVFYIPAFISIGSIFMASLLSLCFAMSHNI